SPYRVSAEDLNQTARQFKTEMLANPARDGQNHFCSQSKTCPVLASHHPGAFNKPTFVVNNGTPNNSTHTLPRKMITAENNQPCDVMSDCRVFKTCHVSVT